MLSSLEAGDEVAVLVADPYTRTNPVINKFIQKGYTTAINNYPASVESRI